MWAFAIFFLALGLGEVCTGGAWNLPSEGTGVGAFFPAGQSSRRGWCTACVDMDRHVFVIAPSAPQPPQPRQSPQQPQQPSLEG